MSVTCRVSRETSKDLDSYGLDYLANALQVNLGHDHTHAHHKDPKHTVIIGKDLSNSRPMQMFQHYLHDDICMCVYLHVRVSGGCI